MLSPSVTGNLINKVLMELLEKLCLSLSFALFSHPVSLVMTSIFRLSCGMWQVLHSLTAVHTEAKARKKLRLPN